MSRSLEEPDSNWDAEWEDSPPFEYCPECDAKYVRGDIVIFVGGADVGFICCYCQEYSDCTNWYIEAHEPDPDRYRDEMFELDWPMAL